jgi:NDP-sugar pyrophosphorylase family protein
MILAGGLGTRIRSTLGDIIKPMAPIGEPPNTKPFLELLIRYFHSFGVKRFVICVGMKPEQITTYFNDGKTFGIEIEYAYEDEKNLLGTGGAIRNALPKISTDTFLVANGDSICLTDLRAFQDAARNALQHSRENCTKQNCIMLGVRVPDAARFGTLNVQAQGNKSMMPFDVTPLSAFVEKTGEHTSGIINAGVYVFSKTIETYFPTDKKSFSLERDVFELLPKGSIGVVQTDAPFIDIGVPEDLARAGAVLDDRKEKC